MLLTTLDVWAAQLCSLGIEDQLNNVCPMTGWKCQAISEHRVFEQGHVFFQRSLAR